MPRVHWIGTGLSAVPGVRRLIEQGHTVSVWNRTVEKAEGAVAGLDGDFDVRAFSMDALRAAVQPGDVVVSMLPGDFHIAVADLSLEADAHFVSSSYISDDMRARDAAARDKSLCLVNEVGVDPGVDHLMAHSLMADYTTSDAFSSDNAHYFKSYCGGLPEVKNDFCYKFSWSPLGVLKALKSPSKSIQDGKEFDVDRPWNAIDSYKVTLPRGDESFEVYPNRDSLPFMAQYGFGADWNVQQFVRGTLRYDGWSQAWSGIFAEVESLDGPEGETRLAEMSRQMEQDYSYDEDEADRVVLVVDLQAQRDGEDVWSKSYLLDAYGNDRGSAMARLVSTPVSFAVEAILAGEIEPGVSAAPSKPDLVNRWLDDLNAMGEGMRVVDNLGLKN